VIRMMEDALRTKLTGQLQSLRPVLLGGRDHVFLDLFDDLMDHNELGLALDVVCDVVLEPDSPRIDSATFDRIRALHTAMSIEDDCVERLQREKLS
jgi:hypothetical protein